MSCCCRRRFARYDTSPSTLTRQSSRGEFVNMFGNMGNIGEQRHTWRSARVDSRNSIDRPNTRRDETRRDETRRIELRNRAPTDDGGCCATNNAYFPPIFSSSHFPLLTNPRFVVVVVVVAFSRNGTRRMRARARENKRN